MLCVVVDIAYPGDDCEEQGALNSGGSVGASLICAGFNRAVCRMPTTASSTCVSLGKSVPFHGAAEVQVAHTGLAAYSAPSRAAAVTVPQVLNASPNHKIAKINRNTTGKTTAASAISLASESHSNSPLRSHIRFANRNCALFITVICSPLCNLMNSPQPRNYVNRHRHRRRHSKRHFDRLGIIQSQLDRWFVQGQHGAKHVKHIPKRAP